MVPGRSPLFVERERYRRRRLMDAARILPVFGFLLVLLPVLWTQGGRMGTAGQAQYLFALWVLLIVAAAALSRPLGREGARAASSPRVQPAQPSPGPDAQAAASPPTDAGPPGSGQPAPSPEQSNPAGSRADGSDAPEAPPPEAREARP